MLCSILSPLVSNSSLFYGLTLYLLTNACSEDALQRCKKSIEIMANTLGLEGFSRIDAFVNVRSGEVCLSLDLSLRPNED